MSVRTVKGIGYFKVKWDDVYASTNVLATLCDHEGTEIQLPMGAKLMRATLVPFDEATKQSAQELQLKHMELSTVVDTSHSNQARIYMGLSNWKSTDTVPEKERMPVGTLEPLNIDSMYSHMRPSLTAADGRAFHDLGTPLWIDAWLCDTIGVTPDPYDFTRKGCYINVLFHHFDNDPVLQGSFGIKPMKDMAHFRKLNLFTGEINLQLIYEYAVVNKPSQGMSDWGEFTN